MKNPPVIALFHLLGIFEFTTSKHFHFSHRFYAILLAFYKFMGYSLIRLWIILRNKDLKNGFY